LIQTEAISAVGRVAASLVHEIRNPLSSVKMNLQILSRPVAGDPRLAEHARIARDQVERLERMLTDLLDFGRPLELRLERVRLADVMARAKADVEARAEEREVAVAVTGPAGIEVEADPSRIAQVLVNLLANAIDASPRGGRVELEASERIDGDRRWVCCEVRDSGPGIRPEHHEAIFDPFFTTKEGGTGLGLSMVKKIAALHGGRVELESEPGRGTLMRLVLPGGAAGP
jgi:two-component system sensor histidine kinase HydH